jgi:putative SOS response-associated peptidase YedK
MCGRITLTVGDIYRALEELPLECAIDLASPYRPSYNVAPSQLHPILYNDGKGAVIREAKWGLLPPWSKDPKKYFINARLETVEEKPTFRDPFRKRRCLIPLDGFYEWKADGKQKQPYWFHLENGVVFYLAGIYNEVPERTFAVLTTSAAAWMRDYHERMPVTLTGDQAAAWLEGKLPSAEELNELLMKARPVSTYVNTPDHNDPLCIEVINDNLSKHSKRDRE